LSDQICIYEVQTFGLNWKELNSKCCFSCTIRSSYDVTFIFQRAMFLYFSHRTSYYIISDYSHRCHDYCPKIDKKAVFLTVYLKLPAASCGECACFCGSTIWILNRKPHNPLEGYLAICFEVQISCQDVRDKPVNLIINCN